MRTTADPVRILYVCSVIDVLGTTLGESVIYLPSSLVKDRMEWRSFGCAGQRILGGLMGRCLLPGPSSKPKRFA